MNANGSKHVLILDDDTITLDLLGNMVAQLGDVKPYMFSSSIEAAGFLHSPLADKLDLVICDWKMPGIDGVEFLKQFRVKRPDTPFVLITASPTAELVKETLAAGVTDMVAKPLNNSQFSQKLADYLVH